MNEKMNLIEEVYTLPEAPWIHISIEAENMKIFEAFCERNRIPFEVIDSSVEDTVCSVRDGLDAKDVVSYMLRSTHKVGDLETAAMIHMLLQVRTCCVPQYEYELHTYRTKEDDWVLSHFDDPPTLECVWS